ncbi:MAG TPA: lysylphosphatidylglycerol synthase transmembrane domain-containing protein [Acidimicrobiales bacterium]|nr:lysylphosphatidylglycerol synthase transmembrane domain-containing protein [Acidimicrobiales bacterium]
MRREVKWTLTAIVAILVIEIFVLPRLGGGRKSLHLLSHVNFGVAFTALAIEAAALVAFAQLTYQVLPIGILSRRRIMQIDLSTLSFSHVMPGGTAFGAALMYRLLSQQGVRAADAGFAIAMQGVGSAVVLNAIFWLALVVSLFFHGYNPLYAVAAGLGILLMASFAGVVVLLTKGRVHVIDFVRRFADRLPFVDGERLAVGIQHFADRLRVFAAQRTVLRRAVAWAAANWLLDAACLWVFIAAFHVYVSPIDLLVAYGLANILAVIPITPSGLGVVEAVLITTLHGFGVPLPVASLGVIGYRLVNFWLPIPVGGLAYLSLRFSGVSWRDRLREVRKEVSVAPTGMPVKTGTGGATGADLVGTDADAGTPDESGTTVGAPAPGAATKTPEGVEPPAADAGPLAHSRPRRHLGRRSTPPPLHP